MKTITDEASFLDSLRAGDETAFTSLVEEYHPSLVRLAWLNVRDKDVAEELAQDTWLAVFLGLSGFEGRSSLKTWIFTILTNKARTRSQREKRVLAFSDIEDAAPNAPTVAPDRFVEDSTSASFNHWKVDPAPWVGIPEEELIAQETMDVIRRAIGALPEGQSMVITLRDMEELSSQEICNILGISETNQRVLLHRARAKVRQALENYLQLEN